MLAVLSHIAFARSGPFANLLMEARSSVRGLIAIAASQFFVHGSIEHIPVSIAMLIMNLAPLLPLLGVVRAHPPPSVGLALIGAIVSISGLGLAFAVIVAWARARLLSHRRRRLRAASTVPGARRYESDDEVLDGR